MHALALFVLLLPSVLGCVDYTVVKGDTSDDIVNNLCQTSRGCQINALPRVENKATKHCPTSIAIGEVVQVCCGTTTTTTKCPDHSRTVKSSDSVFLTIDDGPNANSRAFLLNALKQAQVKVTFFESGYNLCNDLKSGGHCHDWAYEKNIKNLVQTVKDGHMLAAHSDNHYYDAVSDKCTYIGVKPQVRPAERAAKCGNEPIQNMVQGAHQVQLALESKFASWETKEEKALKQQAIDDVWTYSRLPCSDIWRTRSGFSETNLPGVSNQAEIALRNSIADTMYSGKVKCRPDRYNGIPWENYGFDSDVDWKGDKLTEAGEVCRIVKLIEDNMESETNPNKQGKLVLLTHDYFFDSKVKANVFTNVATELVRKGYTLKTMNEFESVPKATLTPSTKDPSTNDPSTKDPTTKDPTTKDPATKDPTTKDPATTKPQTEAPNSSGSVLAASALSVLSLLLSSAFLF